MVGGAADVKAVSAVFGMAQRHLMVTTRAKPCTLVAATDSTLDLQMRQFLVLMTHWHCWMWAQLFLWCQMDCSSGTLGLW